MSAKLQSCTASVVHSIVVLMGVQSGGVVRVGHGGLHKKCVCIVRLMQLQLDHLASSCSGQMVAIAGMQWLCHKGKQFSVAFHVLAGGSGLSPTGGSRRLGGFWLVCWGICAANHRDIFRPEM